MYKTYSSISYVKTSYWLTIYSLSLQTKIKRDHRLKINNLYLEMELSLHYRETNPSTYTWFSYDMIFIVKNILNIVLNFLTVIVNNPLDIMNSN